MDEIQVEIKERGSPQIDKNIESSVKDLNQVDETGDGAEMPSIAFVHSESIFDHNSSDIDPNQLQTPDEMRVQPQPVYVIHPSIPNPVILSPQNQTGQPPSTMHAKTRPNSSSFLATIRRKRCILITFLVVILAVLCGLIIYLAILGAVPCSFKNCSGTGVKCTNTPFNCQIGCQDGFKSNGQGSCVANSTSSSVSFFGKSCTSTATCNITQAYCDSSSQCNCQLGYYGDDLTDTCQECGISKQSVNLRVVGGIVANPYSWPALGIIQFGYETTFINYKGRVRTASLYEICSVFVIDKTTLVTAGHCINTDTSFDFYDSDDGYTHQIQIKYNSDYPNFESLFTIFLGIFNLTNIRQSNPNALILRPSKIYRHEDYDTDLYLNDIAVVKLGSEIKLNDAVQIACLPTETTYNIPYNTSAYLAGWGLLNSANADIPKSLYNVNLTIYDGTSFCKMYSNTDWKRQICAGDYYSTKDSCNGDSGGPLSIYDEKLNKFIAVGIVSYGKRTCGQLRLPSIYTRISYYVDWIRSKQYS